MLAISNRKIRSTAIIATTVVLTFSGLASMASQNTPESKVADPECPSTVFNPYICAAFNGVGSWVIPSGTGSNNGGGNNHLVALSVRL
jgi:hypothetical protein